MNTVPLRLNFSVVVVCVLTVVRWGSTQLVINVKNLGGDVVQETISANVTDDTVNLEFLRSDGTLVTQLIDFRNDLQILKALILGEEERGQSQYQVMCFVLHFPKDAFISSDAMSKLRQKNPGAVRTPEEVRGRENYTMDYTINFSRSKIFSPHIEVMCSEAREASYTRHEDIQLWSTTQGLPETTYLSAVKRFPTTPQLLLTNELRMAVHDSLQICTESKSIWTPCQCHLELGIGWYPCGLKYCKGKGESKNSAMRCGIKTCSKSYVFSYYVSQKQQCLWDE